MGMHFSKMQALGNDFVVIDAIRQPVALDSPRARKLADRHFGVGCDQVLIVEPANGSDADFRYRILNADGSEVGQCGNGARCFAKFVRDKGLTDKTEIVVETLSGRLTLRIDRAGEVTVNMGVPCFEPAEVPFDAPARAPTYPLEVAGQTLTVSVLSLGNPHAVQVVEDVERAPVRDQGPLIERHPRFPQRVNAGYLQVVDPEHARVRVYERGAGETLACGSGACAAVVAGRQRGLLWSSVAVSLRGGVLRVAWQGEGEPVYMTGPARTVYEGEIDLEQLEGD